MIYVVTTIGNFIALGAGKGLGFSLTAFLMMRFIKAQCNIILKKKRNNESKFLTIASVKVYTVPPGLISNSTVFVESAETQAGRNAAVNANATTNAKRTAKKLFWIAISSAFRLSLTVVCRRVDHPIYLFGPCWWRHSVRHTKKIKEIMKNLKWSKSEIASNSYRIKSQNL